MSKTDYKNNTVEWNQLNWRKIQKAVFKLQKRIYQAYVNGDTKKGRRLQKTLIKSYYNRLLSVRNVSQDNQGKKTAGVDKVKSLTPKQRLQLAKNLKLSKKAKPIRRIWIPKPGRDEKRPLGIPVMRDRATQALAKSVLEPKWEAIFEPNSYGFRPGRSAHDAIQAIFDQIRYKSKYVLDADISKCFDNINHQKLLDKLNTFPSMRRQVRAWLKANIFDFVKHEVNPNHKGTPQGGNISLLLANIALHGMENEIKQYARTFKGSKRDNESEISLIRYADDFVIMHKNLEVVKQCQKIIGEWLSQYDLELKPEKTSIVHTLEELDDKKPGFDFLGFNVRQYPVGKYQSGKNAGKILGFKTLIKPSKESIKRHYKALSEICERYKAVPQEALIRKLNPIIRGWCNYYRATVSKKTFSKMGMLLHKKLERWAYRRHPMKSKQWIINKYWKKIGLDNWVFGVNKGITLLKHPSVEIKRHIKVKGVSSPYNGNIKYWATRKGKHPELKDSVARLLKKQKGKCNWCGLTFQDGEKIEKDHITPKSIGGKIKDNLQLLHKHCHDVKTKEDLLAIKKHKSHKEHLKFMEKFNLMNWYWIDDIPTLVGTHKEPGKREAV